MKLPWLIIIESALAIMSLVGFSGCDGITVQHDHQHTHTRKAGRTTTTVDTCTDGRCPRQKRGQRYQTLYKSAVPYVYIPVDMREPNYSGGSCVHASMETVFRIQHEYEWAKWWRKQYHGGEYVSGLTSKLEKAGWKFAYTEGGGAASRKFLKDCCDLRLGCVIGLPSGHAQTLVGMDSTYYYVVNNNGSRKVDKYTHARFYQSWQGWGVTVVGNPPPPEPFL